MDAVKVREEYFNRMTDLEYKRRKSKEDLAVIAILLMLFIEYLTNGNVQTVSFYAPFIPQIKNIENVRAVVSAIDRGLDGQGKLEEEIDIFKERNKKTISYLTHIIPQKPPEIKQIKPPERRVEEMKEQTKVVEQNNAISVELNKKMLLKKMKIWNTQRDKKVRKTIFHNGVDRQMVGIDEQFRVQDMRAHYPADSDLPDWERLNCRCYLTYY